MAQFAQSSVIVIHQEKERAFAFSLGMPQRHLARTFRPPLASREHHHLWNVSRVLQADFPLRKHFSHHLSLAHGIALDQVWMAFSREKGRLHLVRNLRCRRLPLHRRGRPRQVSALG